MYDYPSWGAALSRIRGSFAERFEIYLYGLELANAFFEECNPQEILSRWKQSNQNRRTQNKEPHPIDHDFLAALSKMPRCSGIALGIDRLIMALTKTSHIKQTPNCYVF